MNRRAFLVAALALPSLAQAAPDRREYLRAHREWTRKLVLYWEGSTALFVRVTLLEPGFRAFLAEERRRLLGADDADHAAFLERMASDGERFVEFVFSADSGMREAERFGVGDDKWNLRCSVDGRPQPLAAIDRVRRPSPLHQTLYPQQNQWSELWIARFERQAPGGGDVLLEFGGGFGNGACRWEA